MKRILVTIDDELYKELSTYPNKSGTLREAFRVYNSYMATDNLAGVMRSVIQVAKRLGAIENAVAKIADSANVTIDKHSEWGA